MNKNFQFRKERPKQPCMNGRVLKFPKVKLVDETGKFLGETASREALENARSKGLDLLVINEDETLPVAKIVDYGKYKYQESKKEKKVKQPESKTFQVTPVTGNHDLDILVKKIQKNLDEGHQIVLTCFFRKKQLPSMERFGLEKFEYLFSHLERFQKLNEPKLNGTRMNTTIKPQKK